MRETPYWKTRRGTRGLVLCVGNDYHTARPTEYTISIGRNTPKYIVRTPGRLDIRLATLEAAKDKALHLLKLDEGWF